MNMIEIDPMRRFLCNHRVKEGPRQIFEKTLS